MSAQTFTATVDAIQLRDCNCQEVAEFAGVTCPSTVHNRHCAIDVPRKVDGVRMIDVRCGEWLVRWPDYFEVLSDEEFRARGFVGVPA